MRLVKKADIRPNHCAVLPHMGHAHPRGYVDTGVDLHGFDNHIYISVVAVEQLARAAGLPTPGEVADLGLELQASRERIAELEAENQAQAEQLEAVAVLKRYGTKVERKPGRPSKSTTGGKVAA